MDVVQLAVMANRLDSITREMTNTLVRTARSTTLACRDFSCSICSSENEMVSAPEGAPVHVFGSSLLCDALTRLQPDLRPGDAYLHNDPYLGNSHPADLSVLVPVFFDDEHVFTAIAKAHQIDIGNALPTTYMPDAVDLYAEGGLIFPCVKVQQDYRDVDDMIRLAKGRIRAPETWYGDYLATLAAVRIAETRLHEFCRKYGLDSVRAFVAEWLDYSERVAAAAISRLPNGTAHGETTMDAFRGVPEDGLHLKVTVDVRPEEGRIVVDLRDNPDCMPNGLNLSESTARNGAVASVLTILNTFRRSDEPPVVNNAGVYRRIEVRLRENCVVGIPRWPHSCSMATNTVHDRLMAMVMTSFTELSVGLGHAEPCFGSPPFMAVVSGVDPRDAEPYVLQLFQGTAGGAGNASCDGWLMMLLPGGLGIAYMGSVEVDELKYPIVVWEKQVRPDSEGAGWRRGAPGNASVFGPRRGLMDVYFSLEGRQNPPRGRCQGGDALGPSAFVVRADGRVVEHEDIIGAVRLAPGERVGSLSAGGGGYGHPYAREPERVRADVVEGYLSAQRAEQVYGVALCSATDPTEVWSVDEERTSRLRGAATRPPVERPTTP